MSRLKLTMSAIHDLKAPDPSGRQVLHWDTEQRGFGVLCSGVSDTKAYVVQREVNGKTRRTTLGRVGEWHRGGRSLEDARSAAAKLVLQMREGIDPKEKRQRDRKAGITLKEILEQYLVEQELSANSRKLYRHWIERWLKDWLGKPLREITRDMVEQRFRTIKTKVAARNFNTNSIKTFPKRFQSAPGAATANATMLILRALWNYAEDKIPDLPRSPVRIKKTQWNRVPARDIYVSGDQLPAFYTAVMGLNNRTVQDYVLLLLFTGLRKEEAASLRWSDIDFRQRIIRIPAHRTKAQRKLDLPMSDYIYNLLVARRSLGFENEYVFPGDGKTGHLREPARPLRRIGEACGVPNLAPHDLRRTFITVAGRCRIAHMELKAIVNHAMGGDITAGYSQISTADLADAMQTITDRLKELCQTPELGDGVLPLRA